VDRAPNEEKIQQLIDRLAPLMQYRRRKKNGLVKLTLEDLVAIKETVEFGPGHERLTTAEYRRRIEERIQQLLDRSPILQKIKDGEPVISRSRISFSHPLPTCIRRESAESSNHWKSKRSSGWPPGWLPEQPGNKLDKWGNFILTLPHLSLSLPS